MKLYDYVLEHAIRVCGKCIDGVGNPEKNQPEDHSVDLTFFKVASKGGNKSEFLSLVQSEYPEWLDGDEHNYLQIGGEMGDQGVALMTIGLGHVLGAWNALSPDIITPFLDFDLKQKLAGNGMVSLKVNTSMD